MSNKNYTAKEIEKLAADFVSAQDDSEHRDLYETDRETAKDVLDNFLAFILPPVPRSEVEALRARIKELEALVVSDDI